MLSSLADRLKEAMSGPKKVTGAALAKACGIKPPSVSDWLSGKSKSMDGNNLIDASELLGVRAKWLIKGVGPKFLDYPQASHHATDSDAPDIQPKPTYDAWVLEAIGILQRLDDADRRAAVINLRTFVQQIGPPGDGQTLPMATQQQRVINGK